MRAVLMVAGLIAEFAAWSLVAGGRNVAFPVVSEPAAEAT